MGYRLNIENEDKSIWFYGSKHYGYTFFYVKEGKEKFESVRYLMSIGKLTDEDMFYDDNEMTLTADQFEIFLKLYSKELERIYEDFDSQQWFDKDEELQALLKDKGNKKMWWD